MKIFFFLVLFLYPLTGLKAMVTFDTWNAITKASI